MCGITGFYKQSPVNQEDRSVLKVMNDALTHRGPDDSGYWTEGNIALAMRRLKIIDLDGGHQPIANRDETIWTVFNGEIYNFQELREELIKKGYSFRSKTDTEVIVHLYEEEGEAFVHRLRGMFAIAIWDKRHEQLLIFRDRMGIKPLYYSFFNGTLVFASELKSLMLYPGISRDINLEALSDYLSYLYIPTPKTIYRGVHKLPAAHYLKLKKGELSLKRYWDLDYSNKEPHSEEEWCEIIRSTLSESVKLHMISDVPLGAFLSGGVDSSSVVGLMSQLSSMPVKTYSMGFDDERFNELPFARDVATAFKTDHHEQLVMPKAIDLLPTVMKGFDEPFADSSAIPTYLVSQFARQDVTVVLSGDGGDELFGGYLWTRKELWLDQFRKWPKTVRDALNGMILEKDYRPKRETSKWSALKRFLYDAHLSVPQSFARRAMSFQPWMKEKLFQGWLRDELSTYESWSVLQSLVDTTAKKSTLDQCLYMDSKVYLPDDILAKVDRMSMMHSLEARVPLLDHKVVEMACKIPDHLKFKGRTTKYLLKKSMKGILPESILTQRKHGFAIPLKKWFQGELSQFAKDALLDSQSCSVKYFDSSYTKWILDQHQSGNQSFGTQIYALVMLEMWFRKQGEQGSGHSLREIVSKVTA